MTKRKDLNEMSEEKGGYDYESAYSAAEEIKLDPKGERKSRSVVIEEEIERRESPRQTRERLRKEEKRAKNIKRAIIIAAAAVLVIAGVIAAVFFIRRAREEEIPEEGVPVLELQSSKVSITELYTCGTHLNMSGTLPLEATKEAAGLKLDLVLYDGGFISVPIIINENTFTISQEPNNGLYLDDIPRSTYVMFLRTSQTEPYETEETTQEQVLENSETETESSGDSLALEKKKEEPETEPETEEETEAEDESAERYYRYYALSNETGYPETVYYTMSSFNSKIVIGNETEYSTMQMNVMENTDDGVVDIVIDPAHGGKDPGAYGVGGSCEKDYLLPLAQKIKSYLEAEGVKVALTRESDSENIEIYGDDGRIDRACRGNAKYMLSLHMNDSGQGMTGLEIYANPGMDMTFAASLNDAIQAATGIGDSANAGMVGQNIYIKTLSQKDVEDIIAENTAAGLKAYEPKVGSSYQYILRETGGIVTGAFKDDRNPGEKYNSYCDDNTCPEGYLLQLGYITDENDLNIMNTKMDDYAKAIAESLLDVYGSGYPEPETESPPETAG